MSNKPPKKAVHQPDDKFFKTVMKIKENAKSYFETLAPEWAVLLDLETLTLQEETFIVPNLKTFDADIVYRCRFKNSEKELTITFLWENKSVEDDDISIQVGLYIFLSYYKMVKTKGQILEPIIPLFFYNGEKVWRPKTIHHLFQEHPFFEFIQAFLPNFDYHFTDITQFPKRDLVNIRNAYFRSAMVAMGNKHSWELLKQNFPIIFDVDGRDEDMLITLGYYILGLYERLPHELQQETEGFDYKIKSNIMTTAAILDKQGQERGEKIGEKRGEKIGEIRGIRFAKSIMQVELVLKGLAKRPNLDIPTLQLITGQTEADIKAIQQIFEKNNRKKTYAFLCEKFKDFGELTELEITEIENLLTEFLPKFKKKKEL